MMKNNTKNFKRGFTLMELLTVVAIIGIMSAIVLPNLSGSREKSRDARRLAELKTLEQAVESYFQDGHYEFPNSLSELNSYYDGDVPTDPQGNEYRYLKSTNPKGYCIGIQLERPRDTFSNCNLGTGNDSAYYRVGFPNNPSCYGSPGYIGCESSLNCSECANHAGACEWIGVDGSCDEGYCAPFSLFSCSSITDVNQCESVGCTWGN